MRATLYTLALGGLFALPGASAQELDPTFFYLAKGQPVSRVISLGDPGNWSTQVSNRRGESHSGKVKVNPTNYQGDGDALQLTWAPRKKMQGNVALYGNPIDISAYKDAAALTIEMRIDSKPDTDVRVGLDCGYPCRADINIRQMIRSMPTGEWFALPLPLNCFKGDTFDLSKINGPFTISTQGKLGISITNIRLEKLADGEKGCAE